ncbi:hypothetical protein BJX61DRAFT_532647 [Aspergillus egyptiacus]|nr:hypothetical protein BJX61DRAFT_532647 [Aspergillus egyptiacus]
MDSAQPVGFDEDRYRKEVLVLSEEQESAREQLLTEEATELGLKIPDIQIVTSLAASIASGAVDISSPVLSSGSSTDRISVCETAQSPESPALDQLATSLSECTISSGPVRSGSIRSIASLSTRPTSFSSSESRLPQGPDGSGTRPPAAHRNSLFSVISGSDKKEKDRRRSSIKSAIEKIHFRKRRTPPTVLVPVTAKIAAATGEDGVEKLYVEPKPDLPRQSMSPEEEEQVMRIEVPVFDNEALLRSLASIELKEMREAQTMERDRHVAFQNNLLGERRRLQQSKLDEMLAQHRLLEEKKREKNIEDASRMEERQLVVEMEQVREFERAKTNSRTRIKHMEGYMSSSSRRNSRSPSISGTDSTAPSRNFTPQNEAQLAQEYHDYETMDQLHASKIKVLREQQEIRLRDAIARMDRELDTLIDKHAAEISNLQKEHQKEEMMVLQAFDAKKTKLRHRWALEEAILRKNLENQHGKPYGPLPPLSFSDSQSETRDSAICVSDADGDMDTKRPKDS